MLTVNFKLDSALEKTLKSFREEHAPTRAVVVTIKNEVMQLHGKPIEATTKLENDLSKVRDLITADKIEAAFIIVKLKEKEFAQVFFCQDGISPKVRMVYATGAGHLAEASGLPHTVKEHVGRVTDIVPSLFAKETESTREELMTEGEKLRKAIDKMEVAPNPVAMPGVVMPLTSEGMQELEKFARGEVCALTFTVESDKIVLDKKLAEVKGTGSTTSSSSALSSLMEAVKALIPPNHPRFVVFRCPVDATTTKAMMVYICPSVCKARELMVYASSKASFLMQAKHHGVTFARRLELDSTDELKSAVEEALAHGGELEDENPSDKPAPPRPVASKGPRMLI
ncbi:putative G-actin binding protein, putative,twinfilin [Trypanosoma theileri]|uniref:Putative G-actin binding protein, putative,twinfilin n=1 Tax=Trypanosoma theileri TaxID=67003 RepID=A0A1X0P9W3_9TRYP|nr:putative G-actin binding protein, putative,twinfilin [Trypanosoma theileri]ORC93621.1 putative G-actin binding protein, putative,twinfilin [Trypanosoma theileri]